MTEVLSCLQSFLCFLCFFQVFLQLAPKGNDRKYLKFFGNLVLVLLVLRPVTAVFGNVDSLDQILELESFRNEYSELQMHMEGLEELKNTVVEKNFHREVEEQLRKIPEALGLSVLSLTVSYDDTGAPESVELTLLGSSKKDQEEVQEELARISGLPEENVQITAKEAEQ